MANFAKIMSELRNPTHQPGRSGKDLSHRKVLTMKIGELLPVLCEEVLPRDYFEIDTASLVRACQPLQTAAFMRCKVCFDFFFVPSTAIWSNFNAFYTQKQQQQSSVLQGSAYEPNMTLEELYNCCNGAAQNAIVDSKDSRFKILQLLGYGDHRYASNPYSAGQQLAAIGQKSLTTLPLGGYNLIYNMHYRNAWRDEPSPYDRKTYNFDWIPCGSYANSLTTYNDYSYGAPGHLSLVQMHYHGWYSDLFMGSLPNQQFGSVSTVTSSILNQGRIELSSPVNFVSSNDSLSGRKFASDDDRLFIKQNSEVGGSFLKVSGLTTNFDVIALRKALALQKFKEQNARAGWKASAQTKAFFGVDKPKDKDHEIDFLQSYEFPVMVDEVVSQNGATGGNLGDLGGKAIGVGNGRTLKFDSDGRHGYLYCIAYIMPESEYDAVGIDQMLVRSEPFDRYCDVFENLGLTPISKYNLNAKGNPSVFNDPVGYAPRYWDYKTRLDKVYGEFVGSTGTLRHWVTPRIDLESIANSGFIPTYLYYVYPTIADNVFGVAADGSQSTDQFMLNVRFTNLAVRPMSDVGLPSL